MHEYISTVINKSLISSRGADYGHHAMEDASANESLFIFGIDKKAER